MTRLYSRHSLTFVLPMQDLLCYLIDDGGFLIMSNQIQDWNKVRWKPPCISCMYKTHF